MGKMIGSIRGKSVCAVFLLQLAACAVAADIGKAEVWDTTAQHQVRVQRSVQLAVASAGERLVSVGERGIVLLSDDQGMTWRHVQAPVDTTLTGVQFVDGQNGWAVGHGGVVLATRDGGQTWGQVLDGSKAAALELESARRAARNEASDAASRRLRDAERLVREGADKPFLAVRFIDARRGVVAGAYGLLFGTEDGGEHWFSMMDRVDNPSGRHLYAIAASTEGLVLAGEQGSLFRSQAWGGRFVSLASPYAGSWFGVLATRDGGLFAYGLRGNAYRLDERGDAWIAVELPPVSFTAGTVLKDGRIVLANESGQLFVSTDGGRSFAKRPMSGAFPFTGMQQAADGNLVLSGVRGLARHELVGAGAEVRS